MQNTLDFELPLTNAGRLIPVHFRRHYFTVCESDARDTLTLAPPPTAVRLTQARDFADSRTAGNRFDLSDLANDFEVHAKMLPNAELTVKGGAVIGVFG